MYFDKRDVIRKLLNDKNYEMIVGVYDDERRLIAALFNSSQNRQTGGG
jgi:hypothetical protein